MFLAVSELRVLVMANAYPDAIRPHAGAYVHATVAALREHGVTVDVMAVRGYAGAREYARAARETLALNRRGTYDIVHASYGRMGMIGRLQIRAPLVVAYTGGDILGNPDDAGRVAARARLEAGVYRQVARVAAATITKSENMAAVLPAACRARNRVIPSPTDARRFGHLTRRQARERLGWPATEPTVLFAADPQRAVKNHPLARAAVDRLDGVRLAVSAGIPAAEMPTWMAAADALVLTSFSEGSPNVVREAMAAELPVVAVPVGDVPERLAGIPGCAVCEPDPDRLAAGLRAALEHGRTPAARAAVASCSPERVAAEIVDLYEWVLRRRGARS